jgi:hypothetical protein
MVQLVSSAKAFLKQVQIQDAASGVRGPLRSGVDCQSPDIGQCVEIHQSDAPRYKAAWREYGIYCDSKKELVQGFSVELSIIENVAW